MSRAIAWSREPVAVPAGRPGAGRGRRRVENIESAGDADPRRAKNHPFTAAVVSPESYDAGLEELRQNDGRLSSRTRESLALEGFALTARYDTAISRWFAEREEDFPAQYTRSYEKVLDLPYGENPHQRLVYSRSRAQHLMSMVRIFTPGLRSTPLTSPRPPVTTSSCRLRRSHHKNLRGAIARGEQASTRRWPPIAERYGGSTSSRVSTRAGEKLHDQFAVCLRAGSTRRAGGAARRAELRLWRAARRRIPYGTT